MAGPSESSTTTSKSFIERFNLFLYRQHIRKLGPEEIETARKNRGADWGVFVFSKKTAPANLEAFSRYGNDFIVVWDAKTVAKDVDVAEDVYIAGDVDVAEDVYIAGQLVEDVLSNMD